MKTIVLSIAVLTAIAVGLWVKDIYEDRKYKLEVLEPITLLENAPQSYPRSNVTVGQVNPGDPVMVLRMGYGKDFRAWRVRSAAGQDGWFVDSGKNVRVNKPKE
ncbi:MAG TPA: hypothetical protein VGH16_18760 [Candidatus Binatia bacterium]|jgi:hypothetical protein